MRADGDVGRWRRAADWGVPLLLIAVQLPATWLVTDAGGAPLGIRGWTVAAIAVVTASAALVWRRVAPVPVLFATVLISAAGVLAVGNPDAVVGGVSDVVALYSLAVHHGPRRAVAGCVAAFTVALAVSLRYAPSPAEVLYNEVLDGFTYLGVTTLGQVRRQHKAARGRLRDRLAGIEREHRAAAAAERERLARDVHDVAGHHLSAVVVHSGAAAHRDDRELTRQALSVAADTGQEVLSSLSRLVDEVTAPAPDGGLRTLLPPLCHGLVRLGVPVSLTVEGRARELPAEVTTAAYRIVQESLTNAMRYASGAPVRVIVRYGPGVLAVDVENGAPGGAQVPALGGRRGIRGMRERAEGLGGVLDAGPAPGGGWSVVARLPTTSSSGHGRGWPEVLDAVTLAFYAALPLLGFLPPEALVPVLPTGGILLVVAAMAGRVVPLWWRRRAPYAALAALTVADTVWAVACTLWSPDLLALFVLFCPAQLVMVYSAAAYRGAWQAWPAAFVAPLPWGIGLGLSLATDPEIGDPVAFVFGLVLAVLVTIPLTAGAWACGVAAALRSRRWGFAELDTATARTSRAVHAERSRVAVGLSGTVLDRTARLVQAAETGLAGTDGDAREALRVVTGQARAALTDMRALLDAMEETA
ncbi:sensor histidine kinase [Actinomadura macra]|uniref:sensor histidine kinase n=1 Tax=Actinomadura macra TaxID=46164 RepID=UPI0008374AA8|nr:histidine kinase [Actinomadura macra]